MNRNLVFGWWSLLVYLALGIGLESLHGFKLGWYLDIGNETRRLMFTLGHAHGTALALVNIAAGVCEAAFAPWRVPRAASGMLRLATIVLPAGFLLGGATLNAGDPGFGIILVPIGAVLLLYGVGAIALSLGKLPSAPAD